MLGRVWKSSKMLYDFELYMCIFVIMLKHSSIRFQRNLRFANRTILKQLQHFEVFETVLKLPAAENS
jgi:hypothetical protein